MDKNQESQGVSLPATGETDRETVIPAALPNFVSELIAVQKEQQHHNHLHQQQAIQVTPSAAAEPIAVSETIKEEHTVEPELAPETGPQSAESPQTVAGSSIKFDSSAIVAPTQADEKVDVATDRNNNINSDEDEDEDEDGDEAEAEEEPPANVAPELSDEAAPAARLVHNDSGDEAKAHGGTASEDEKYDEIIDRTFSERENSIDQERRSAIHKNSSNNLCTQSLDGRTFDFFEDRPPIPLQTYRWEDLRRAKQQGGYPWTHLYKVPLGPNEELELSPVRFYSLPHTRKKDKDKLQTQAAVDTEDESDGHTQETRSLHDPHDEFDSSAADEASSAPLTAAPNPKKKHSFAARLTASRDLLKRVHPKRLLPKRHPVAGGSQSPASSVPAGPTLVDKIKSMADKQLDRAKQARTKIKRIRLGNDDTIALQEDHKIMNLKESPGAGRKDVCSYVKQDSDDVVEILELNESPTETRRRRDVDHHTLVPDEIIELPVAVPETVAVAAAAATVAVTAEEDCTDEPTVAEILEEEMKNDPPKVARKEHIYEDIDEAKAEIAASPAPCLVDPSIFGHDLSIKQSLAAQDRQALREIEEKTAPLDRLVAQSSEDDPKSAVAVHLLAPISSIDSASSDEANDKRTQPMCAVQEESETEGAAFAGDASPVEQSLLLQPSPSSEKRVTFSPSVEEERKEDVELRNGAPDTSVAAGKWSKMSDHEYEPIADPEEQAPGATATTAVTSAPEASAAALSSPEDMNSDVSSLTSRDRKLLRAATEDEGDDEMSNAVEQQRDLEDRFFSSQTPDSRTDYEVHTSQVDSSAIEELPLEPSSRRGWIQGAQNRGKDIQQRMKSSAAKIRSKMKSAPRKPATDSPKSRERRRFKAPEFAKLKKIQLPKFRRANTEDDSANAAHVVPAKTESGSRFKNITFPKFRRNKSMAESEAPVERSAHEEEMHQARENIEKEIDAVNDELMERAEHTQPERSVPEIKITQQMSADEEEPAAPEAGVQPTQVATVLAPAAESTSKRFKRPSMPTMPKFRKPDFSKIKRPEFTKISRPEMPKIRMPQKLSNFRLNRSKSLKEERPTPSLESAETPPTPPQPAHRKRFDFDFGGTYPRIFGRKQKATTADVFDTQPDTPQPVIFATVPRSSTLKKQSHDAEDTESGKYTKYDDFDRESSMERRMRQDLERYDTDTGEPEHQTPEIVDLRSDEQKQMDEYDKENREIHELSRAKQDEFKQRKPMVRQESDLVSEDSKDASWPANMNVRGGIVTDAAGQNKYEYNLEDTNFDKDHELTPFTNQETQSSGSSSYRHRKGVIEEIDDDEFFLRSKGISQDDIQIGEYISSAIREGLATPHNALALVGRYNADEVPYYDEDNSETNEFNNYSHASANQPPKKPLRHKRGAPADFKQSMDSEDFSGDFGSKQSYDVGDYPRDEYIEEYYPPDRPLRRAGARRQYSDESYDDQQLVPHQETFEYTAEEDNVDDDPQQDGYGHGDDDMMEPAHYEGMRNIGEMMQLTVPPLVPRRRKKKPVSAQMTNGNRTEEPNETMAYRTEHEYTIPLAQPETFNTPTASSYQSRSRSQVSRITDDDRTSHGAESLAFDGHASMAATNAAAAAASAYDSNAPDHLDMAETNGYATVRKDPPPRPPAPTRRGRGSPMPPETKFFTMPHPVRDESPPPARPLREYSTIGPSRPPRRKSACSLNDSIQLGSAADVTDYEEIEDDNGADDRMDSPRNKLVSGEVISKMKYRPLPPPPRPPRDSRSKQRKHSAKSGGSSTPGGGGYGDDDDDEHPDDMAGAEILTDYTSGEDTTLVRVAEVEVSTQTDALPDDFVCEEFEITDDMRTITPTQTKTLSDVLKGEQEAELERARQLLADEQALARGLNRFREANQRNYSERSRASSLSRPKTPRSRPISPAVVLERKISTPTLMSNIDQIITQAMLIVRPLGSEDMATAQLDDEDMEVIARARRDMLNDPELRDEFMRERTAEAVAEKIKAQQLALTESLPSTSRLDLETDAEGEADAEAEAETALFLSQRQMETETDTEAALQRQIELEIERSFIERELAAQRSAQPTVLEIEPLFIQREMTAPQSVRPTEPAKETDPGQRDLETDEFGRQPAFRAEPSANLLSLDVEKFLNRMRNEPEALIDHPIDAGLHTEQDLLPPVVPPRRKSSSLEISEDLPIATEDVELCEDPPLDSPMLPQRLQLADLEVERLRVTDLQATKIMVSDLQGVSISTQDMEVKSGNLIVKSIELPPGFIDEIVERIRATEREHKEQEQEQKAEQNQHETQERQLPLAAPEESMPTAPQPAPLPMRHEDAPARPPPPPAFYHPEYLPYSIPPPSFYQLRAFPPPETEDSVQQTSSPPAVSPPSTHRRRRHHRRRDDDSSSDEERDHKHHRVRQSTRSPEPSVSELGAQFVRACNAVVCRFGRDFGAVLRENSKDEQTQRHATIAIVLLVLLIAFFMVLSVLSGRTVHHHHWEFFNPPGDRTPM